ncbi:hypothetical protein ACLOJK_040985, partial [Asimina triloba]
GKGGNDGFDHDTAVVDRRFSRGWVSVEDERGGDRSRSRLLLLPVERRYSTMEKKRLLIFGTSSLPLSAVIDGLLPSPCVAEITAMAAC